MKWFKLALWDHKWWKQTEVQRPKNGNGEVVWCILRYCPTTVYYNFFFAKLENFWLQVGFQGCLQTIDKYQKNTMFLPIKCFYPSYELLWIAHTFTQYTVHSGVSTVCFWNGILWGLIRGRVIPKTTKLAFTSHNFVLDVQHQRDSVKWTVASSTWSLKCLFAVSWPMQLGK